MILNINNCKNIDQATLNIEEKKINIKYAINGTGKTTIAQVIEYKTKQLDLNYFIQYKYKNKNKTEEIRYPEVEIPEQIKRVSIFNEEYVNKYIYKSSELIENSFEIFVKPDDYDNKLEQIKQHITNIHILFDNNAQINNLINQLDQFLISFGNKIESYSKSSNIGKGIANGNKLNHIDSELNGFRTLINSDVNIEWLAWHARGKNYLNHTENCPYCSHILNDSDKEIIKKLDTEYNSKYVESTLAVLKIFNELNQYFDTLTKDKINLLTRTYTPWTKNDETYLNEIRNQANDLKNILIKIRDINFNTLNDFNKIIKEIHSIRINLTDYNHFNSQNTQECITLINNVLDEVSNRTIELKQKVTNLNNRIKNTIQKNKTKINYFLENAGYNYIVDIEIDKNKEYHMILKSKEGNIEVNEPKYSLSFGERNALALILFMYKELKEKTDLIILDDPISSFDQIKKYAIFEALFRHNYSFKGKTVVILTHDFEPVIKMFYSKSLSRIFSPKPVCSFLYNVDGILTERTITSDKIKSFYKIVIENINSDKDVINRLIYLRRYYEACDQTGIAWELISNIFHEGREQPQKINKNNLIKLSQDEINEATKKIQEHIKDFNYDVIYKKAHDIKQMVSLYKNTQNSYEKLQIFRLIYRMDKNKDKLKNYYNEVYHIENDYLFQLDPTEFPTIPHYIIDICDEYVNNIKSN